MGLLDNFTGGKGNRLKQVFEKAKPALNLSAEQEQKIKDIFKNFREKRDDLKDEGGSDMRDDIRTARQDAKQQLMDVLNDDQRKIVREHLSEWKEASR